MHPCYGYQSLWLWPMTVQQLRVPFDHLRGRTVRLGCGWCNTELLSHSRLTRSADVYSFGMMMWELFTGEVGLPMPLLPCCPTHWNTLQADKFYAPPKNCPVYKLCDTDRGTSAVLQLAARFPVLALG